MEIKNLHLTNLESIYEAFREAFLNYFVPFSGSFEDTKNRWNHAGVDLNISYGAFDGEKLAAFILNVRINDMLYNFAMGVIPEYRGNHLIEKIFSHLPKDFRTYQLEVITENHKAINLYSKLGYKKKRELISVEGLLNISEHKVQGHQYDVKDHYQNEEHLSLQLFFPSAEGCHEVLCKTKDYCETHELRLEGKLLAYAQFIPEKLALKEVGAMSPVAENLDYLFREMKLSGEKIRVMNIDSEAELFLDYLEERGLRKFIAQYEMEKII